MPPYKGPERRVRQRRQRMRRTGLADRRLGTRVYHRFALYAEALKRSRQAGGSPVTVFSPGLFTAEHEHVFEVVGRPVAGAADVGSIEQGGKRSYFHIERRTRQDDRRSGKERRKGKGRRATDK